jgi:LPXTG-site transpeptidase (sortase) family protein
VQALIRNENPNLGEINGPTTVIVGQTYQYTLSQSSIPTQQQLQHLINFPSNIFEIRSISVSYSTPQNGSNNQTYADACGWENNPESPSYLLCVGPNPAEYPNGVVGGIVNLTYQVRIRSTGSAVLSSLFYGYNNGEFNYQYSQDPSTLLVNAISQATETSTATLTQTSTNTATVTGTIPTSTATATATITGTPPTATATSTGTPPTPTATGTITPGMTITKSANVTSVRPGDSIAFTIRVGNTGTAPATNVTVTDTFQSALFISSVTTTKGTYTVNTSTQTVTVDLDNIAPGQSVTITVVARVNTTVTSTTTFTNFARLTYTFGSITFSENSNNVSYVVLISTTLPPTGLSAIEPGDGNSSNSFTPVLIVSLILGVLGLLVLILSARNAKSEGQWSNWLLKTGLILVTASVVFGLLAILIKPDLDLNSFLSGSHNRVETEEGETVWRPTPEGPFILMATPTELDSLPDYPIPTPDIKMTPNSGEPAPDISPVNRIAIPAINLDTVVKYVPFEGQTWLISGLKQEVAWMGNTSWPGLGGNTGLAGHVTLRDASEGPFRYIADLSGGELVRLYTEENIYNYQIRSSRVVEDNDLSVIANTDYSQLTLITCTEWDKELGMYLKRIVVFADLVEVEPIRLSNRSN